MVSLLFRLEYKDLIAQVTAAFKHSVTYTGGSLQNTAEQERHAVKLLQIACHSARGHGLLSLQY